MNYPKLARRIPIICKKHSLVLLLTIAVSVISLPASQWVKTAKDPEMGWRLMVDGKPMAIHGVVWSFTPIGENYSFDLWSQSRSYIKAMIDTDGALMQEMGVNVIRVFTDVPPEWVTYLYQQYGIYTVVNDLFGRYGMMVDGRWQGQTNYASLRTRELILEQLSENIKRYVDVPGVLFYLLGNENNYGLEWDSDRIENLPVGQRLEIRAGYLYSLFEEGIQIVKDIDPTKPVGIVNGDIQYLNIIKALTPSLDILGVNTYRGKAAHELFYESVDGTLNVPIVFTEFGADAFNVVEGEEDQYNQALYIKSQWEEIYRQSYGKGGIGNSLGGFVFEWMDEWWKTGMTSELDIHNESGSWSNGAYAYDSSQEENNMNEEWFGIVAQSPVKRDGIHQRRPRAAYYLLQDLWKLNQFDSTTEDVDAHFARSIRPYVNRAEIAALKKETRQQNFITSRGQVKIVGTGDFNNKGMNDQGLESISTSSGQWAYLGLDLKLSEALKAGLTFRVQGGVPNTVFEQEEYSRYGSYSLSADSLTDPNNPTNDPKLPDQDWSPVNPLQIYDGYLNWETRYMDFDFYYHNGHEDWANEGDYFHLLPESFDFFGMDKEGSRAPFGAEFTGKEFLDGFKIYGGPEIYWGASPQLMAKYYYKGERLSFSIMHNEVLPDEDSSTGKTKPSSRRTSAWVGLNFSPWVNIGLGGLFSGMDQIGESYNHVTKDSSGKYSDVGSQKITALDTLAGKIDLSSNIFLYTKIFARYTLAGRVAEAASYITRDGTQMADVGTGNRHEFEGGFTFQYGGFSLTPKFLARVPLSHPLSFHELGTIPRNPLTTPFAVYRNREAYQAELILTIDPTGDTYFHDWNNKERENAVLAGYLSFLYSFYEGPTDKNTYKDRYGTTYAFGSGLPEVYNLWSAKGRIVWNAAPRARLIAEFRLGTGQSHGEDDRLVTYGGGTLSARLNHWLISSSIDFNSWGHEDWYRQFNITYPLQWTLDISRGFELPSFLDTKNRIGIRWKGRTYDEYAPDNETNNGLNSWRMEVLMYLSVSW